MIKIKSIEKENNHYRIVSNTQSNTLCKGLRSLKKELRKLKNG